MKKGFWFITLLFAAFSAVGQETIRVYAASSLTNVLNEIIERYQGETGNKVLAVYGGSSSLSSVDEWSSGGYFHFRQYAMDGVPR